MASVLGLFSSLRLLRRRSARLAFLQMVTRTGVEIEAVKLLQFPDTLQRSLAKRALAVKSVQHDALEQVAKGQIAVFGESLQYFENPLLHAYARLYALDYEVLAAALRTHGTNVPWYISRVKTMGYPLYSPATTMESLWIVDRPFPVQSHETVLAMNIVLNEVETRVLGALVEKDITTPDYYPLSLNALVNACNQKNNRDPVMTLNEDAVREALDSLGDKRLAGPASGADSRVTKYEHRLQEVFNFDRREIAVLCVLLLRGPQTPGELRGRTERMYHFGDLDEVQSTLQRLIEHDPPLARVLPRQPGTKEARYAQLFSKDADAAFEIAAQPAPSDARQDRISRLEDRMAQLESEVTYLKEQMAKLGQH